MPPLLRLLCLLWPISVFVVSAAPTLDPRPTTLGSPPTSPRRDLRIHDPSTLVHADGHWYVFGTGRRILASRSRDLLTWEKLPPVLASAPAWAAAIAPENQDAHYWAPDIIRLGDLWHLYYSVSAFGKNTSAIALATSPSLDPSSPDHRWTDRGIVLRSTADDDFNAIDPSLLRSADGRLWMAYGSFWSGLHLVELDPATGLRLAPSAAPVHLAHAAELEAPTLYQRGEYTYLFVNEGLCCKGVASTYRVRVGRSRSVTGPYLDDQGRDLRDGGGRPFLSSDGDFIGPGHPTLFTTDGRDHVAFHFYDRARNGAPTLAIRPVVWTDDGWPRAND